MKNKLSHQHGVDKISILFLMGMAFVLTSCAPVTFSSDALTSASCSSNCQPPPPPPPVTTYSWIKGDYGACSKTCGGGTQTQTLSCLSSKGTTVDASYCQSPRPTLESRACNTQACPPDGRLVRQTFTVEPGQNQVDILVIVDDSYSMAEDNVKLAQKMGGFINSLANLGVDYQMCITTTDTGEFAGRPLNWIGTSGVIFNKDTQNKQKVFNDTIDWIGSGWSNDERGIYAMNLAVLNYRSSGCFRPRATQTVILISDEDERSVGGIRDLSYIQYQPLEALDTPSSFINTVATQFNVGGFVKTLIVNSIIVRPGDKQCEALQDAQENGEAPSFPGRLYNELSVRTGGYVGSICDNDYYSHLQYTKEIIRNKLEVVQLECQPLAAPQVTITPAMNTVTTVTGSILKFNPVLPEYTTAVIEYYCPK